MPEPERFTKEELASSIQKHVDLMDKSRETEITNEMEFKKRFNISRTGTLSRYYVSIETENFSANISKFDTKAVITSKCNIETKSINTLEEFQKAKEDTIKERKSIEEALVWIASRYLDIREDSISFGEEK